ncbi:Ferritin light chain [Myotis brandtii]|uniref:Ferritin light chain n=1 Tax=Myotis brandtii TaxID=109478 RepID=S7P5I0_MYOBR|nr:Ferritin light chain [Myotis brandtii]
MGQNSGHPGSQHGLGEKPGPGPFGAAGPGSTPADPHLCDFRENHFLDEQVKQATPDSPPQAVSPQAGLGKYLFERLTSSTTRSLWNPEAFEGPLYIPLVSDFCLGLSLKTLAILFTTLKPSPMHWTKWKQ